MPINDPKPFRPTEEVLFALKGRYMTTKRDMKIAEAVRKLRYYGEVTPSCEDNPTRKLMREAADLLAAIPSWAMAAPGGWKLVPVEPTPEMSAAGFVVPEAPHDPSEVYRAMLMASPNFSSPWALVTTEVRALSGSLKRLNALISDLLAAAPKVEQPEQSTPFTCKYCGAPSHIDPSDQTPPVDYCYEEDHGESMDKQPEQPTSDFAAMIHYPDHWDTAAYPTLNDAIAEVLACTGCSECEPEQPAQAQTDEEILEIAIKARDDWNLQADEFNQWTELDQEEKDMILARAIEAKLKGK